MKSTNYNSPIDIWAVGCVMAEMYLHPQPLFYGANEKEVLYRICSVLGTPTHEIWNEGIQLAKMNNMKLPYCNGTDLKNLNVVKRKITAYGAIILKEKKLPVDSEDFALALCDHVKKNGLNSLPLDSRIEDFLLRTEFFIKYSKKETEFLRKKYDGLIKDTEEWLRPFVKSQKINAQNIFDALYWYLDGTKIESNVPVQIILPNGRKRKIKYEKKADGEIQPVLEIIIQQIFGCFDSPKILERPVLLKLLSPASRPLQITDDLENFWTGAWIEICKEMKGRYPKHNWDYRVSIDDKD